jgi:hypothetical protein
MTNCIQLHTAVIVGQGEDDKPLVKLNTAKENEADDKS